MSKPVSTPRWASTGGANIVVPSSGKKDIGWVAGEAPDDGIWNWHFNLTYQWTVWLDAFESTIHTWTALQTFGSLAVTDGFTATRSSVNQGAITGTGNGTGFGVNGIATNGIGVWGTATTGFAVKGVASNPAGVGAYGEGGIGVYGYSATGKAGYFSGTTYGVHGQIASGSASTFGVLGDGDIGTGVYGFTTGVSGATAYVAGVRGFGVNVGGSTGSAPGGWFAAGDLSTGIGLRATALNASAMPLQVYRETAGNPGTPNLSNTAVLAEIAGQIHLTAANPAKNSAVFNTLSPMNIAKCWGSYTNNGTVTPTWPTLGSINVASIADDGSGNVTVTFASAMANANYAVMVYNQGDHTTADYRPEIVSASKTVNGFTIQMSKNTSSSVTTRLHVNMAGISGFEIGFFIFGAQ